MHINYMLGITFFLLTIAIIYPTDAILVFLIVATAFGIVSSKLGMPALVGEIIAGELIQK